MRTGPRAPRSRRSCPFAGPCAAPQSTWKSRLPHPAPAGRVAGLEAVVEELDRHRPELGAGGVVGGEVDDAAGEREIVGIARRRAEGDVGDAVRPGGAAVGDPRLAAGRLPAAGEV